MMPESDQAGDVHDDPRNWNRFVDLINDTDHGNLTSTLRPPNLRIMYEDDLILDFISVAIPEETDKDIDFGDVSSPEDLPLHADRIIVRPPNGEEFEVLFELRGTAGDTND